MSSWFINHEITNFPVTFIPNDQDVTFLIPQRQISVNQNSNNIMREDNQLLVVTHLSQLIILILGFGSLLLPLILWLTQKERVYQMDAHGKNILNFQLSLIIYCILCIPLILLFGLGLLGFLILGIVSIIFPIINAIKASKGEIPKYPLSLKFIS